MPAKIFKMNEASLDYNCINECARLIERGGIVAFPTETVYGLGVNSDDKKALRRLAEIKARPSEKPFTIHTSAFQRIEDFTSDGSIAVYKLIDRFWPGPLTLLLRSKKAKESVGLRCPSNPIAQELINRSLSTIVASSANLSDQQAAIDSGRVVELFSDKVDAIIDAGKTQLGIESTIVDLSSGEVRYIRIGAIEKERIEKVLNTKIVLFVCTGNSCRSVMAGALLKRELKALGRSNVEVIDAGTATLGGAPPTEQTIKLLADEGIEVKDHTSNRLTRRMLKKADLILVMEKAHEEYIATLEPTIRKRVFLLREFTLGKDSTNAEIVDPIGKSLEVYKDCFSIIKQAVERLKGLI